MRALVAGAVVVSLLLAAPAGASVAVGPVTLTPSVI